MRVCLVYPDIGGVEHYGARKYYHGLGYISSVLRQGGHETTLAYLQREPEQETFLQQLADLAPDVVAFSATTHQYPYVETCAGWIKENLTQLVTVVGGIHATLAPEKVIANPNIDVVCVGEGEYPLLELADALQDGRTYDNIANLWVRRNGQVIRNALRPLIADLDVLPYPDRPLFGFTEILAANEGWVDMMAGRGCPYGCSYCCNPALRQRFKGLGKYVRFRSPDNILAEVRTLASSYPINTLNFQDDVFTLDREWTLQFCHAYGQEFEFPFWINTRVERSNDEELVAALAHAGCRGIRIGLESGNEQLRAEILKRSMSNEEIRQAFALARKYGLETCTCNMLGIPGETAAMIEETIALNRELEPRDFQFSVFYPYPMTELYDLSVREGLIAGDECLPSYYERRSVLRLPTLSQQELQKGYDHFMQLKHELRMKQSSPMKYRVFRLLRSVLRDSDRAWSVMQLLGRIKSRLIGRPRPAAK
jgi:anaerobic magnesium-protoporphyrin IX monomethyl ester cyclase